MKVIVILLVATIVLADFDTSCTPFGVRLTFGEYYSQQGGNTQLYVSFNTYGYCPNSTVSFGNFVSYSSFSCTTNFVNFTWVTAPYFNNTVYTCAITGINYNQPVLYAISAVDNNNNTLIYPGKNISTVIYDRNTTNSVQFFIMGDWNYYGLQNTQYPPISNCLELLKSFNVAAYQGIIYTGDMAYNLDSNNGTNYVQFITMLEPFASVWPFMATAGNHEVGYSSALYVFNLTFPYPYLNQSQMYYVFSLGPVTFIQFNPYAIVYNTTNAQQNMQFLMSALNNSFSVSTTFFTIAYSHYPMICSDPLVNPNCTFLNSTFQPFEQMLANFKSPIYFSGHAHSYERSYPINALGQVVNTDLIAYANTTSPIYIIEGIAGTNNSFPQPYSTQYYTAVQSIATGFGIINITSNKEIFYKHVSAQNCLVSDGFGLIVLPTPEVQSGFPVWFIVLLSILGAVVLFFIIWGLYVWHRNRKAVREEAAYRQQIDLTAINSSQV